MNLNNSKTTAEKFNEAIAALENIEESEINPEDHDKHLSLIMELHNLSGKYE